MAERASTRGGWRWYRARLAAMPWPERGHRLLALLRRTARRRRAGRPPAAPAWNGVPTGSHRIAFFDVVLDFPGGAQPVDWSRDYASGRRAPLLFYGDLDYRDPGQVGDSKYTWELNRHQFLLPWALEWASSGEPAHAAAVVRAILDWIAANPRYLGINWTSSLELALRIVSWGVALDLCRDAEAVRGSRRRIAASVAEQADYIRHTLSLYSSANNHLIGELTGLLAAAALFPEAPRVARHARFARERLLVEAFRQNFPDGVNREQATYYHHYTLEYLLTALVLLERLGRPAPARLEELVRRMLAFVDAMTDERGRAFPIGDEDAGTVTGLNLESGVGVYESLLWSGWLRFGDAALGAHAAQIARARGAAPEPDRRSRYWHGEAAAPPPADPQARPRRRLFPDGGYFVAEDGPHRLLFKAGPFGYPSIAAHAHCDQLSVCLARGPHTVLGDAGTYVYHTDERWRRFFKGTSAHNTVGVDGLDQAEYAGAFLWSSHADGRLELVGDAAAGFEVRGRHDGYRRLPDPVEHERRVRYRAGEGYEVVDIVCGRHPHRYTLHWSFGPEVELEPLAAPPPGAVAPLQRAAWRVIVGGEACLGFVVEADGPCEVGWYRGDEALPAGFSSPGYRDRRPVHHVRMSRLAPRCELRTRIETC